MGARLVAPDPQKVNRGVDDSSGTGPEFKGFVENGERKK